LSRVGSQQRTVLALLDGLRPYWRRDAALPARIEAALARGGRFGSRDRRLYRELIYTALRFLPWFERVRPGDPGRALALLAWLAADTPDTREFRAESAAGLPPCPATTAAKAAILALPEDALLPGWLREECPEAFSSGQRDALLSRAPLWIRLQTDAAAAVFAEFAAHGWAWRRSPLAEGAIALPVDAKVAATAAYREGRLEIQDIGSQLVLASASIPPGERWLDACAGAGGKTLQLAALLGPHGHVDAADPRPEALTELRHRAERAGLTDRISAAPNVPRNESYDGVLIDAPCSGSGTWRRLPHLQWSTTLERVKREAARQRRLLAEFAPRVRSGGRLIYATCSLCRSENEAVVADFLTGHPDFVSTGLNQTGADPGERLWPAAHDGDGFFVARLRRQT